MLPTRDPPQERRPTQTESEGLETNIPSKWTGKKKKLGQQYSYWTKQTSKKRAIKRDPEGHIIIVKGRIYQEDIHIVNIYAPNIEAPKYIKKILEDFKKDIDSTQLQQGTLTPHCQKWTDLPNKISARILWH